MWQRLSDDDNQDVEKNEHQIPRQGLAEMQISNQCTRKSLLLDE